MLRKLAVVAKGCSTQVISTRHMLIESTPRRMPAFSRSNTGPSKTNCMPPAFQSKLNAIRKPQNAVASETRMPHHLPVNVGGNNDPPIAPSSGMIRMMGRMYSMTFLVGCGLRVVRCRSLAFGPTTHNLQPTTDRSQHKDRDQNHHDAEQHGR